MRHSIKHCYHGCWKIVNEQQEIVSFATNRRDAKIMQRYYNAGFNGIGLRCGQRFPGFTPDINEALGL